MLGRLEARLKKLPGSEISVPNFLAANKSSERRLVSSIYPHQERLLYLQI